METTEIGTKAIRTVRETVAADPEFIYKSNDDGATCYYIDVFYSSEDQDEYCYPREEVGRKPGCLVGRMLFKLGYIDESFADSADLNEKQIKSLIEIEALPGFFISKRELQWLATLQRIQDGGATWRDAVKVADSEDRQNGDTDWTPLAPLAA